MGGLNLISALGCVILVLLLAYWCSRFLGKNWSRVSGTRELKVIDQLQIGQDKRILLVKLREHTYLIGVSQAGITLLTEAEGDFADPELSTEKPMDFKEIIRNYASVHRRKEEDKDECTVRRIKRRKRTYTGIDLHADAFGTPAVPCHHDDFFYKDHHYPVFYQERAGCPADAAEYGVGRDCSVPDSLYNESGNQQCK